MSFMQRWSQRKRDHGDASSDKASAETPATLAEQAHAPAPSEEHETSSRAAALIPGYDPQRPLDEQLPEPEQLGAGDDFRAFMLPGVGEFLKRRALRRMFKVGNYNVRDGLDDYDEDYSQLMRMMPEVSARMRQWLHKDQETESPDAEQRDDAEMLQSDIPTEENKDDASEPAQAIRPEEVGLSEEVAPPEEKPLNDPSGRSGASS
ncbi:DUF3306 domain-containing protein [Chromohalobacter salexigens]|uniref:DUF3306 domain-containing protein n=1 Tax=Chromohalobacter moromii TaxID=2860329 RepID=A0A9X2X4Z7_9GAMM|nr:MULTISPECIES: DUF3306 domain-containing protein [Chromohalobacter]NWO10124.1 DUF3306 domain-containing protein [Chromohalobacter salexigens]MCK2044055.1 DUF3306 domain-containing protein [Chromohalobacter moromii]MCK2047041.1 DUF3306 domain-containing protein [Chromohalobacter moromii]MCT8506618.1 DUF3306 domain-containing protein [Chromohalobacter moromii]MCT8515820.1 DUF3306 domain-containing protein [Chromohalobacter sp. TMW 2.2271]